MTNRPRLYPGHRHQWADDLLTDPNWVDPPEDDDGDPIIGAKPPMVTCTVCGLQMPRNAAGLDGRTFTARYHVEGRSLNEQLIDLANQDREPTDSQPEQEPT